MNPAMHPAMNPAMNPAATFMLGLIAALVLLLWGIVLWLSLLSLEDEP